MAIVAIVIGVLVLVLVLAIAALVIVAVRHCGGTADGSADSDSDADLEVQSVQVLFPFDGLLAQYGDELSYNLEPTVENPNTVWSGGASVFVDGLDGWE
jgi:uncharacterized membrane protein